MRTFGMHTRTSPWFGLDLTRSKTSQTEHLHFRLPPPGVSRLYFPPITIVHEVLPGVPPLVRSPLHKFSLLCILFAYLGRFPLRKSGPAGELVPVQGHPHRLLWRSAFFAASGRHGFSCTRRGSFRFVLGVCVLVAPSSSHRLWFSENPPAHPRGTRPWSSVA